MASGPGLVLQPTARMAIVVSMAVWRKKILIVLLPCLLLIAYGTARSLGSDLPDAARMYAVRLYDTPRSCQPGLDFRCNGTTYSAFATNSQHACGALSRCGTARSNPVCGT